MLEFLKFPFLVLHFSYYISIYLPDDVICNNAIYIDNTTLYSKCNQASDLWQQLELACELESNLLVWWTWVGSGLLISVLEKLKWSCLAHLITLVLLS